MEPRIIDDHLISVAGETESKESSAFEKVPRRTNDHIALILSAERFAADESNTSRSDFELPTELRIAVMRNRFPVRNDDLPSNLSTRVGGGMHVDVGSALTETLDQIWERAVESRRARDYVRLGNDTCADHVTRLKVHRPGC